ncbi:MAG TPA: 2OG-Fe(II) oxygenase [Terriglobales bacterium]|nr:2OG-Fe(II) oxygenase [Terriglobales bacterium]
MIAPMANPSAKTEHVGIARAGTEGIAALSAVEAAALETEIAAQGFARLPQLLPGETCHELIALYASTDNFRSRVVMARHGYGSGEYKYFSYPLPGIVADLREQLYPVLAIIANRWQQQLNSDLLYPSTHGAYLESCHAAGQTRPTPLLLRYEAGDFNCLHQDIYGEHVFPLQVAILLSQPGADFAGGEFILTEQRPRRQSRASVVPLSQGDAVIFPVRERPIAGSKGFYRGQMRHGVSQVRSGLRYTLGVIFHDAA